MKIKLPYGIKNGSLLDISEVDSGMSCDCYCPSCNHPLVAKKGNIKQHHFAHYNKPDCVGAVETALHIKAKEIISNHLKITLPPVRIANRELFGKTEVTFDHVELEKRTENIIPDIVGYINGRPLLIEIAVNHFVDQPKKNIIRQLGVAAIEIDVKRLFNKNYTSFQFVSFENVLINGESYKSWINNEKQNEAENLLKEIRKPKKITSTNLDTLPIIVHNCPIQKRTWKSGFRKDQSYASVFDDCWDCPFGEVEGEEKLSMGSVGKISYVLCNGHKQDDIDKIIRKVNNTDSGDS